MGLLTFQNHAVVVVVTCVCQATHGKTMFRRRSGEWPAMQISAR